MVNRHFHIVVADDDKDDQFFLKEAIELSNISCEIKSFYNGSSLLEYLEIELSSKKVKLPDLIILDINMPHVNGFDVLKIIKADSFLDQIPIYMLSTTREEASRKKCIDLGALHFFTKPTKIDDLKKIVAGLFASVPAYTSQ